MSVTGEISDSDAALIVAFLDGEMGEGQAYEFAKRLAREPELAAELESFAEVDFAQRRVSARDEAPPSPRRLYPWLPLAVAATALIAVGSWWWIGERGAVEPEERVALVEAGDDLADYARILGIEEGGVPDGSVHRGGSDGESEEWKEHVERVREFVGRVAEAQRTTAGKALDANCQEMAATHFAISFEAPGDRAAVVVAIAPPDIRRKVRRLYPPVDRSGGDPPAVFPRFEGGKLHLLHRDPAEPGESGLPEVDRGFVLLKPLGGRMPAPRRMTVFLALREAELTRDLVKDLDKTLVTLDEELNAAPGAREEVVDRVEAWFTERGFRATRLVVEDPKAK